MVNPESEIAYKQQEVNFIEWTKVSAPTDYDIKHILLRLRDFDKERIDILDVGGGIGTVGAILADSRDRVFVDVIDNSSLARQHFIQHERMNLIYDNYLNLTMDKSYDVIIFRTVLHHIIGGTSASTLRLQNEALAKAHQLLGAGGKLYVIENFYEPFVFRDLTGELIFQCTRLQLLAPLFRSMGANTAGEGVRFRSRASWIRMFAAHNFELFDELLAEQWDERLPLWQRVPFLCREKYQALLELKKADPALH